MMFAVNILHANLQSGLFELFNAIFKPFAVHILDGSSLLSNFGLFLAIFIGSAVHILDLNSHSSHFEPFSGIYMPFAVNVLHANSDLSHLELFPAILYAICFACFLCKFPLNPFRALFCYLCPICTEHASTLFIAFRQRIKLSVITIDVEQSKEPMRFRESCNDLSNAI